MTPAVYAYVLKAVVRSECSGRVLEIGSYNVNGSVRPIFADRSRFTEYVGSDMRPGPDVDVVCKADALKFQDETFDVVVCSEMLEHDDRFWISIVEMFRVLKHGGTLIMTTRNLHFAKHDHPSDYWRFTAEGLRAVLDWGGFQVVESVDDLADQGTFAIGRRP